MIRIISSLVDTVFLIILVWSVFRSLRALMGGKRRRPQQQNAPASKASETGGSTARDPVCGIFVSTEVSHRLSEGGKTLHFCSEKCLREYRKTTAKAS